MPNKILGREHTDETNPTASMTITVDNGTVNLDVVLSNLLKIINGLTEDTTPVFTTDYVATYDASASAAKKVLLSKISTIVQAVHTQTGAVATGTTVVPYDDTIPQNTEGDQYMTLAITPTNASNKLVIEVTAILASSVVGQMWTCLFQDSTAGALAVASERMDTVNQPYTITFKHEMTAGTTSATTFKMRAGNNAAGTTTFNGSVGARYMGGVFASSIRITEVQV